MTLPISPFSTVGLYYSGFVYGASGLLLLLLYFYRWKSSLLSFCLWTVAQVAACLITWLLTEQDTYSLIILGLHYLFVVSLMNIASTISLFGVFFLSSMLYPALFGIVWLIDIAIAWTPFLSNEWAACGFFGLIATLIVLIVFNTLNSGWMNLVRFSQLYFLFPRQTAAWKKIEQSNTTPMVSIHIPFCSEPPDMVIASLAAIAKLDYPHFEVIVIDNNTQDSNLWKPVEDYCRGLGKRFRFFHFDKIPGAKAGALNKALSLTSPQAELIAVIDADFVTKPDFLSRLVGFFDDPKTGFVQSCQDYRQWEKSRFQQACYYEYLTHFKLELPGQNEWNINYTIGTMCLIRRSALEEAGEWATWCLTEDSEAAVRIHAKGYVGYYMKDTFGRGLIPEKFEGYKAQRFRWTAGPVQQFQKHWRLYFSSYSAQNQLSLMQKVGELFHSLSTFFSETLIFVMNSAILISCLWFAINKNHHLIVPNVVLILIPIGIVRNTICHWITIRLLGGRWINVLLSSIASRSLIFIRNIAFLKVWLPLTLRWDRTDKFKKQPNLPRAIFSCRWEIAAGIFNLIVAIACLPYAHFLPPDILLLVLLSFANHAASFLCAPLMAYWSECDLKAN